MVLPLLAACASPDPATAAPVPALAGLSRTVVRTDRAVYRAGETVHARIWRVDPATWQPVPGPLTVALRSTEGPVSDRVALAAGTSAAALRIPSDGWPGTWELVVSGPAGRLAHQKLVVQASERLPYRVDARLAADRLPADATTVEARVQVRTPGGAPVAGKPVHGALRAWGHPDAAAVATTAADGSATLSWPLPACSSGLVALRVDGVGGQDPRILPFVVGEPPPAPEASTVSGDLVVTVRETAGNLEITTAREGRPVSAEVAVAVVAGGFEGADGTLAELLRADPDLPPRDDPAADAWRAVRAPRLPWPDGLPLDPAAPPIHPDPTGVWDAPASTPMEGGGRLVPGPDQVRVVEEPPLPTVHDHLEYCVVREYFEGAAPNGEVTFRAGPTTQVLTSTLDAPELVGCLAGRLQRATGVSGPVRVTITTRGASEARPTARASDPTFRQEPRGPETGAWWPALHTDADGRLRVALPALPPGTWRITVDALGGGAAGTGALDVQRGG